MEKDQSSGLSTAARILEADEGLIIVTGENNESKVLEEIASEYGIQDQLTYIGESEIDGYSRPRAITQGNGVLRDIDRIVGLFDTLAYKTGTSAEEIQQVHQKYRNRLL